MKYACIAMDPPWAERGGGKIKRGADRHYPLMTYAKIESTVLGALGGDCGKLQRERVADDAHLWCWVTDNFLCDGLRLVNALGFRYVRTLCWFKRGGFGIGQYLRGQHELCLFGVRGKLPAARHDQPSAFIADRGRHSEKPQTAYRIIERVSPGPRIELFARAPRHGWDVWGNESAGAT